MAHSSMTTINTSPHQIHFSSISRPTTAFITSSRFIPITSQRQEESLIKKSLFITGYICALFPQIPNHLNIFPTLCFTI